MKIIKQMFHKVTQSFGARPQSFKCKVCGAYHQGIKSKDKCIDCYNKANS